MKQVPVRKILVQEDDGFALWRVEIENTWFYWSESKRTKMAVGPTDDEAKHHYNFLLRKKRKPKNDNRI